MMTDGISRIIDQAIVDQQLPAAYRQLVDQYLMPLSEEIAELTAYHIQHQQQPFVLAVNGAQGTGKSTICNFLQLILSERYKLRSVVLSLDDFYLSQSDRLSLSAERHPLFKTRGVPGTHDVELAITTIEALLAGKPVALPRFDKALDDCVPCEDWPLQQQPVDVIVFEGWCVGARPQSAEQIQLPINSLEAKEDSEGVWRRHVNDCLAADYQQLFGFFNYLLMLKAPDMAAVFEWRTLQETKLAGRVNNNGRGLMSAEQIRRFVHHYERLTRQMMAEMPRRADAVFSFAADHSIQSVTGLKEVAASGQTLIAPVLTEPVVIESVVTEKRPIIFTDLDGTLLDHHNYSFAAAATALERIKTLGIPLILNSSKTFAEIRQIQADLDICQPLICENGAAVYIPEINQAEVQWHCKSFAPPRTAVVSVLQQLRQQYHFTFVGFADCDAAGIAKLTGLDVQAAARAGDRYFSEPVLWQGEEAELNKFLLQLKQQQLEVQQGGRFLSVTASKADKAKAMDWLCQYYAGEQSMLTVALGDSPNDEAMLNAADIAVVIKSPRSSAMKVSGPGKIIRTTLEGPAGWQQAMEKILPQFE